MESHLLQMRGLKLCIGLMGILSLMSHLLQMRGLKLFSFIGYTTKEVSHLLQMRGLKPLTGKRPLRSKEVASFTDAWIETQKNWK